MKILQLFYTSGEKGLSQGKGFQTYSMSEGLTNSERSEIERYGVYVPPHNLPSQPTAEEIEINFPIAFTFFQLSSGRYGVCQTKYSGQDYSGRYGNYFCHALILDGDYWPFYPIQLWGASVFRQGLTEKEAGVNETPPSLSALEVSDLQRHLNQNLSFENVAQFIKLEKRGAALQKMLTTLIDYEQSQMRRLVLCDHYENIGYWIAALQMAFPLKLAHTLKFTTYTHDPEERNLLICSTPPYGTRFAFSDMQRNFSFYIFDFIGNNSSQIESRYGLNQFIKVSYFFSKENLFAFHRFLDLLDYHQIDKNIETAYHLFRISCSRIEDLDNNSIIAALDFANTYAPAQILSHLSESIAQIIDAIADQVDIKTADVVTRFLFKVARQTENNQHLETAYNFFFNALDHLVVYGEITVQLALKFNDTIRSLENGAYCREFVARSIEQLDKMAKTVLANTQTPKQADIYFQVMVTNLIVADLTWEQSIASLNLREFLLGCFDSLFQSKKCFCDALAIATQNNEFFAQLVNLVLTHAGEQDNFVEMISECFTSIVPENEVDAVRIRLVELHQEAFVYNEFIRLLGAAKNKPYFFWSYHKAIFSNNKDFSNQYFSLAVKAYLKYLSAEQVTKQCTKLLSYASLITEDVVLTKVIQQVEQTVPLSSPDSKVERKIRHLSKLKKARNISTSPDITHLAMWAMKIESTTPEISLSQLFESEQPQFVGIDIYLYQEYLEWILPSLFNFKPSTEEHGILLNALRVVDEIGFERELILSYVTHLTWVLKKNRKVGREVFMNFMIYYLVFMPKDSQRVSFHRFFWGDVVDMLVNLPKSYLKEIGAALPQKTGDWFKNFKALQKEVEDKQTTSTIGFFKGILGKGK